MTGIRPVITSNVAAEVRRLRSASGKQVVAKAGVLASNRAAFAVQSVQKSEIRRRFDRPIPYTLNAVTVIQATDKRPTAEITFKDYLQNPGDRHYLEPNVYGGTRPHKPFERRLARLMPQGWFAVPAIGARLDAYGNMSRGQIVQILSVLGGLPTAGAGKGFQGAQTARSKKRNTKPRDYFASTPFFQFSHRGKALPFGIYQRLNRGRRVRPVLLFVRSVTYRARYPFFDISRNAAQRVFPDAFNRAVAQLRQAEPKPSPTPVR